MEGVINMKAFKYFIFAFFVFVGTLLHVRADENCSYKDQAALIKQSSNIQFLYTVEQDYPDPNSDLDLGGDDSRFYKGTYLKVRVLNIPDNFYVNVENDFNEEEFVLDNNNCEFDNLALKEIINYKFSVYSTSCPNVVLRLKTLRTPMYNEYSESSYCKGHEDLKVCNQFYNDKLTYNKFIKAINEATANEKDKEEEKHNFFERILSWVYKYWYIFIAILGVAIITIIVIVVIRKRRIF